ARSEGTPAEGPGASEAERPEGLAAVPVEVPAELPAAGEEDPRTNFRYAPQPPGACCQTSQDGSSADRRGGT
ncbi:hypothetical protein N5079_32120, partial [Planotetraspora sp. A-T 1434]